jgi:hypothetical protein
MELLALSELPNGSSTVNDMGPGTDHERGEIPNIKSVTR